MRIVVSTLEGKCLNSLRSEDKGNKTKKGAIELSVDPLDKDIRKDIVSKILAEYNKRLANILTLLLFNFFFLFILNSIFIKSCK
jgi:hypothetical protein